MLNSKRIVVTGIGCLGSPGIGKEKFWEGIVNQNVGVELVKEQIGEDVWDEYYVHKLKNFDVSNFGINPDALDYIEDWKETPLDFDLQYLLAAVKLALEDAGVDLNEKTQNAGLVVTNEHPGMEAYTRKIFQEAFRKIKTAANLEEREFWNDLYFKVAKTGYETQSFMFLYHIARTFNIHRYSLYINNACASGLYAIEAASQMIKSGKVPMVVVTAGDHPNILKHLWFKMLGMYEADGKIKPFSKNGKGLVMGEGAAAVVLEDYEYAQRRKAHIYAEYSGGGFRLEGWQIARPKIGGFSYHEIIQEALAESHINAGEIDLVCPHGFGSLVNDVYEAKAIMEIFGKKTPVTAFKPYVGHNLGGSTLLETIILLLSLQNNIIPPILNTKEVDPRIELDLVFHKRNAVLKTVMKTCCAFAGYNAASVFRKID